MTSETPEQTDQIAALARQIEHHNQRYWQDAAPEISDQAYDALVEALRQLDANHPLLETLQDAPAPSAELSQHPEQRFGQNVVHERPMLSLDKAYAIDEVSRWFDRFDGGAVVMPKIDGIACSLRYDGQGRLLVAATRGNGRAGEDITANILASGSVPSQLPRGDVEVRGEVYIPRQAFDEHLAERFANPRNTAAGALKQKDHQATEGYHLHFFAYDLLGGEALDEEAKFATLEAMGFERSEHKLCASFDEAAAAIEGYASARDELPYETDGVVARCHLASEQSRLGLTAHHPRFAIAFKFSGDVAETELIGVEWQVARRGTITPVALLEPVSLSGAMVRRASLHHAGRVEALELTIPARVLAARRGGVIPHIEGVVRRGGRAVVPPEECPGCGEKTRRNDDFLLCGDPDNCRPACIARILHWAKAFEIDGLGQKLAEMLYDDVEIRRPVELYDLRRERLLELPRMAEKSVDNLLGEIARSRRGQPRQLLVGLGIDELGVTVAERLITELGSIAALRSASVHRLLEIDGVGDVMAAKIFDAFASRQEEITELIERLDLQPPRQPERHQDAPLAGYWVVFTGSLEASDRKTAQAAARTLGAATPSGVLSKDGGLLVVGDRDSALKGDGRVSSKHAKARSQIRKGLDIIIISETEWLSMGAGDIDVETLHERWQGEAR